MEVLLDKSYDTKFKGIKSLKWLPWVGKNYMNSEYKILLVGDTHYGASTESIEGHNINTFTREIIEEMPINRWHYNVKFYKNLHLALIGNDIFKTENLWSNVAFYNFVQNTMNGHDQEPSDKDFQNGWDTFYELIDELKPTICIFLGVRAINNFNKDKRGLYVINKHTEYKKTNNVFPRNFIFYYNNTETKIFAIKHPSKYFSWSIWNKFMKLNIADEIEWLNRKVNS